MQGNNQVVFMVEDPCSGRSVHAIYAANELLINRLHIVLAIRSYGDCVDNVDVLTNIRTKWTSIRQWKNEFVLCNAFTSRSLSDHVELLLLAVQCTRKSLAFESLFE